MLRRREIYLQENERLRYVAEAASTAKSQFLATVSLEIWTPTMKGLTLDIDVAVDVPDRVVGDAMRVRQVLAFDHFAQADGSSAGGLAVRVWGWRSPSAWLS